MIWIRFLFMRCLLFQKVGENMADGRIKIAIEVDGKQINTTSKELDNLASAGERSGKGVKSTEDSLKGVDRESNKADTGIKKFVTSLGLIAIASSVFKVLSASMDDAIKRFDTLNKIGRASCRERV